MDFIYASELKQQFQVVGHYYNLKLKGQLFPCRRVADIYDAKQLDVQQLERCQPQAVVIMMNPGSSSPVDQQAPIQTISAAKLFAADYPIHWSVIKPDNTQYQMMRLMRQQGWQHLRIINLSDLREGNSRTFAKHFLEAQHLNKQNPHSYLHPKRQPELLSLCEQSRAVIAAWGSNAVQKHQAQACIKLCAQRQIQLTGLALETPWYRFASPYRKDQKMSWLAGINEQLQR